MKRIIGAILASLLLCSVLIGCTGTNSGTEGGIAGGKTAEALVGKLPVSFPLVAEPTALNILACGYNEDGQENVFVWQQYEEMTGVDVNWTTVTKAERSEAVLTALTNRQQLDLILRCKLSAGKLAKYGGSGLLLDLAKDGLLGKYAPNCWAYLQAHPDTLASVMNPDGTIYGLPQVNSGAELRVGLKLFVNKQWLERTNQQLPSTTEELKALLTAFRDQDANGNGDMSDEIPLCCDWDSYKTALYGSFGLQNRGFHNLAIDADPETGKVRYIKGSEPYKDFLAYSQELYAGGLLDRNIFTQTNEQLVGNLTNDKVGVYISTNLALLPAGIVDNWVAVEEALTGPNGDKLWSAVRANFHSTGAAVIPSTCQNPELALRWLDYFWTDEGTLFYHMGVEGVTYTALNDGTYDYTPDIYEQMASENLSFDDVVAKYSPYPGGSNPTVEIAPYFMGGEMAAVPASAARALFEYRPTECWPAFTFTEEENETIDAISNDLTKYCDESIIDFVTGVKPLSAWESYKAQLEKLRVPELLQVYQAAVDRYHTLLTALN